ncbi:MAG: hypothetical protein QG643_1741, partial [Pseudomonadota bacterium]|nr:hypothetical protein [Pseudomonadota bacterium]
MPLTLPDPGAAAALPAAAVEALRTALQAAGDGWWEWDVVHGVLSLSQRWWEILGYSAADAPQPAGMQEFSSRVHPDDLAMVEHVGKNYLSPTVQRSAVEFRMRCKDGSWKWILSRAQVVEWTPEGTPARLTGTHTDIDAFHATHAALQALNAQLQANEERWKLALESAGDGVWDWHIAQGHEFFSQRLLDMYGFSEDDLHRSPDTLDQRTHPDDLAAMHQAREDHFAGRTPAYHNEHRVQCSDGNWKWVLTRGMVISRDAQGQPLRMIGTHTDITARKEAEAVIRQQALFDTLTGLPNRRMLRDRLEHEIRRCQRDRQQLAVLFMDLDHFKEINDTLGHDQGDLLLIEAARRIQGCLRACDTVARMGGDEFTIVLSEIDDATHLEGLLQKLLQHLCTAFELQGEPHYVSASIGVTIYPLDGQAIETLFKNADQALYAAKGAGRNRFSFFTPALQEAAQKRVRLAQDLRCALQHGQFRLVYQPIVNLHSGAIHKAEALLRWEHPQHGTISPADFIPVAESSGLIVEIGQWVFEQAAQQVRQWRTQLAPQFQVSINKSPVQFLRAHASARPWGETLQSLGLPGNAIVVEITEGLLLEKAPGVADQLLALGDAGIQVSLDDFGTGYSSLSYLQRFDIDFIKIDQSFVRHLVQDSTDLALC